LSELEEIFEELRGQGMKDKDIVRKIFEENLNADVNEIQRITGMDKLSIGRIKGQVSRWKKKAKEEEEEAPPEPLYKGEPDANSILKQILETHPDVPKKVIAEIMSWAEMSPGGLHPTQVAYLLSNMKGVTAQTANIVAQKYSLALVKAQQEGKIPPIPLIPGLPTQTTMQQPIMPMPLQQTQQYQMPAFTTFHSQTVPYQPQTTIPSGLSTYTQRQPFYTKEDIDRLRSDWAKEQELKSLKDQVTKLTEQLSKLIESRSQTEFSGLYEEIEEPLKDEEGNILIGRDNKPIMIKRRVPITGRESAEVKALREEIKSLQDAIQKKEIDQLREEIRSLRERGGEKTAESEEVKALREQIAEYRKSIEDLKEKMTAQERKRLEDTINRLEQRIDHLQSSVRAGGITTPEGVLATAITEAGRREPVRIIVEGAKEILGTPGVTASKPPAEMAGEVERGGVIRELSKHGLVTRVVERVRG